MYFTNTPYLNSMEAIMIRPPGSIQRGGGKNRSPYKYTKKDCECRFCLYYRKKDGCTVPICPVLDIRLSCGAASFREAVKSVFSEVKHIPFQRLDLGQVFRHIFLRIFINLCYIFNIFIIFLIGCFVTKTAMDSCIIIPTFNKLKYS